jgi:hypothetical protein
MKITVKKLEGMTGIKKQACYGFLTFLEESGLAQRVGSEHEAGKRGAGSTVYELVDDISVKLAALLVEPVVAEAAPVEAPVAEEPAEAAPVEAPVAEEPAEAAPVENPAVAA